MEYWPALVRHMRSGISLVLYSHLVILKTETVIERSGPGVYSASDGEIVSIDAKTLDLDTEVIGF